MNKDPESTAQQTAGTILEKSGQLYSISSLPGLDGVFQKSLVFFLNLAWKSRFHVPVLFAVEFMVPDVRMQLEINVDVQVRNVHDQDEDDEDDDDDDDEDDNDDDEDEVEDDGDEGDDCNISGNSLLDVVESEVEEESRLKED
jgi:hypothetical protein